jgi:hypothetical protein
LTIPVLFVITFVISFKVEKPDKVWGLHAVSKVAVKAASPGVIVFEILAHFSAG